MEIINLVKGEQKILKFVIKDAITKEPINLTDCEFSLVLKKNIDDIEKSDTDFDKTEITNGIVKVTLTSDDLNEVAKYQGQLKIVFPNDEIDKSNIFNILVSDSII